MMKALHELTIAEAGKLMRTRKVSSIELTMHFLGRIVSLDPMLHAFVLVTRDRALADAEFADSELQRGVDLGPLHGIPYGLKDIFATRGIPTTCQSKLRLNDIPENDCAVQEKLKAGGAVLLGKLATHEFALGGPSFDLPFPPARNPWNVEYFAGASSSGSAVAVAAGMMRTAIGSDTSGSIRAPACHCGIVGLKPTYGLVSRRGAFPLSYSLDHCGPLASTVEDAALTLQVIAGHDRMDPGSASVTPTVFSAATSEDLRGTRIGFPRHFFDKLYRSTFVHLKSSKIALLPPSEESSEPLSGYR